MDHTDDKQSDSSSSRDEQQKIAVPYIPPPPPDGSEQKKFKSPMMNGAIIAVVILVGGFMAYNFFGHQLTQLAGDSYTKSISPNPSSTPSDTIIPTSYVSPSPSH